MLGQQAIAGLALLQPLLRGDVQIDVTTDGVDGRDLAIPAAQRPIGPGGPPQLPIRRDQLILTLETLAGAADVGKVSCNAFVVGLRNEVEQACLLYTSDAADE